MTLSCRSQSDGTKCLIRKRLGVGCKSPTSSSIAPEHEPFQHILRLTSGVSADDQNKYAKLFVAEKIRGVDQLAKFDASAFKAMGIPMGDAMEIVEAVRKYTTSKLIEERSSSSMSISSSSLTDSVETLTIVPALPVGLQYYAFASHNWGVAENGFLNHTRTSKLIDKMRSLDIPIWFDHDRLSGNIDAQITNGIDESATFLVFITKDYIDKVLSGSESDKTDWCHYEFAYAGLQKPNKMIAIVMEPDMLDTRKWKGAVGARLGTKMFIDFSSDDKLDSSVVELCRAISGMI